MWRSLWRSIDRFSVQYLRCALNELQEIKTVDDRNRETVIDLLQSIVEVVTYGDRQDPLILDCFMEHQGLAQFVRVLKISENSRIETPILQYLSIMIQNMASEHAIYYCFSNDYINNVIEHQYKFDEGDLALYYVSFLRAVSSKLNRDILCLLVKFHGNVVVSFPLYTEALKFSRHGDKMIRTAVRALTLNIYHVTDCMVHQFITTPPVSKYFLDLVLSLKDQCVRLDVLVVAIEEMCTNEQRERLLVGADRILDDLYHFKDILSIRETRLSRTVTQNLLNFLVFPLLLSLLQSGKSGGSSLSAITSLYVLIRLLQVISCEKLINSVAGAILYSYIKLSMDDTTEVGKAHGGNSVPSCLNKIKEMVCNGSEFEETEENNAHHLFGQIDECLSSNSPFNSCYADDSICSERSGLLAFVPSDNHCLLLASVFLLLTLAENTVDLDSKLTSMIGFDELQHEMELDGAIIAKLMPEAMHAVLKVLASQPPPSVLIQWHAGWLLQKLVIFRGMKFTDQNIHLLNESYERSLLCLKNELYGCWFDHIIETIGNEWTSCKQDLENSAHSKDAFFVLDVFCQEATRTQIPGHETSYASWQRMVGLVKVFILHLQLKAFISKGELLDLPLLSPTSNSTAESGRSHVSETSSASFGSEVSLGSGLPCKIAFSNAGTRDIFMIPVAKETSGKLLLVEKNPMRSRRGIVIAVAPLAGLNPKIEEGHPSWLQLRIREFYPRYSDARGNCPTTSGDISDGKWTLGFEDAEACEGARLLILEETQKQRSSTQEILSPLLLVKTE